MTSHGIQHALWAASCCFADGGADLVCFVLNHLAEPDVDDERASERRNCN